MSETEKFVTLIDKFSRRHFSGALPDHAGQAKFVTVLLLAYCPADAPDKERAEFAYGAIEALDCLRRARACEYAN